MKRMDKTAPVTRLSASLLLLFFLLTALFPILAAAADGPCSLTVLPVSETEKETAKLLKDTKVLVDVYQVASMDSSYNLSLVSPFKGKVKIQAENAAGKTVELDDFPTAASGAKITDETFQKLSQDAAKLIQAGKVTQKLTTLSAGKKVDGMSSKAEKLDKGLYILIGRTDDKDYWWEVAEKGADGKTSGKTNLVSYVHNNTKGFLYLPTLVVLPEESDSGSLNYDVTAILKPEIVKPVKPTPGKPTGFVKTGDDLKLQPFYVAATASGVVFLCLAARAASDLIRRRREKK